MYVQSDICSTPAPGEYSYSTGPIPVTCRHCGARSARKPRGLCGPCYDDKEVRSRYPKYSSSNWRTYASNKNSRTAPPRPTRAIPGSARKIQVMGLRYVKGYQLYHPLDAKISLE